ncbi:MAG TPA: type II secretion system F family protein [Caulobacteraceae bacterium]
MSPTLLMVLAAILGLIAIGGLAVVFAAPGQSRTLKRAQAIADRSRGSNVRTRGAAPDPTLRRRQIMKTLRDEDRRQRKESLSMSARLQQAGLPITPRTFWMLSAALGIGVFVLVFLGGQKSYIGLLLGIGAGLGLPRWAISFLAKRRAKKFVEGFADASDIIVRGIKSGLPVNECLQVIARESPEPLCSEFRRLVDGVAHGMTLEQMLERMHTRMPLPELRFFTIVLSIQQKTGGNLAEALSNLSLVLRSRKLMREKIKALSGEAVASSLIIGSLPPGVVLLISVTTPSYLAVLFHTTLGQLILAAAGIWMGIGVFIMKRMVSFKI